MRLEGNTRINMPSAGALQKHNTGADFLLGISQSEFGHGPIVCAGDRISVIGISVIGIVGRDGDYTAKAAACAIVSTVNPEHITPHSKAFQAIV